MSIKEKIKEEIDVLPEDMLKEIYDFMQRLESQKLGDWSAFALDSGAFDFWKNSEETDYSTADLKSVR